MVVEDPQLSMLILVASHFLPAGFGLKIPGTSKNPIGKFGNIDPSTYGLLEAWHLFDPQLGKP